MPLVSMDAGHVIRNIANGFDWDMVYISLLPQCKSMKLYLLNTFYTLILRQVEVVAYKN